MASPMHQLIAQDLRKRIESGVLRPGDQLPAELEPRDRCGAARNTVQGGGQVARGSRARRDQAGTGTFVAWRLKPCLSPGQVPAGQPAPAEG